MKNCTCLLLVVAAAMGCGKKQPADDKATGSGSSVPAAGSGSAGSASAGSASAGSADVHTAEGSAAGELPVINDCPKALSGAEAVARTIKKACGPVTVNGEYDNDGSLTLEAGAILKVADGGEIDIGYNKTAKIIVNGTAQDPVTITSAGDPVPGAWKGLRLYAHANRSQITGLVLENAGGDKGALYIDGAQDVAIKGSTIRNAKEIGLQLDHQAKLSELSGNTFDKAGKIAVDAFPITVGAFGVNKFDDGAVVQIEGGPLEDSAKWQNPGAPYVVAAEVDVDGKNSRATLELTAGTELRFKEHAELDIGYNKDGSLIVSGTADKPVVFTTAETKAPGAWYGVWIYGKGEAQITSAAFSDGGGKDQRGVLMLDNATASITNSTFKDNKRGVHIDQHSTLKAFDHNTLSASPEPALWLSAAQVGALGANNTFDKDAHLEIAGGKVSASATWLPQSVPYEVTAEITVDDKQILTLSPGVELAFAGEQQFSIGYNSEGTLKANGTKEQPIKLHATRDDITWKGLWLYGHAVGNELANVQLANTSGDAGIVVDHGSSSKLSDITCTKCSGGVVISRCGANLTTANIKPGAGTGSGEIKPTCN